MAVWVFWGLSVFLSQNTLLLIFKNIFGDMEGVFDLFPLNEKWQWFLSLIYKWTAKFIFPTFPIVHITLAEKFPVSFFPKAHPLSMETWSLPLLPIPCEFTTPCPHLGPPAVVRCFLTAHLWATVMWGTGSVKLRLLYIHVVISSKVGAHKSSLFVCHEALPSFCYF